MFVLQTEDGQDEQPEVLPPGWERCEGEKNSFCLYLCSDDS